MKLRLTEALGVNWQNEVWCSYASMFKEWND